MFDKAANELPFIPYRPTARSLSPLVSMQMGWNIYWHDLLFCGEKWQHLWFFRYFNIKKWMEITWNRVIWIRTDFVTRDRSKHKFNDFDTEGKVKLFTESRRLVLVDTLVCLLFDIVYLHLPKHRTIIIATTKTNWKRLQWHTWLIE